MLFDRQPGLLNNERVLCPYETRQVYPTKDFIFPDGTGKPEISSNFSLSHYFYTWIGKQRANILTVLGNVWIVHTTMAGTRKIENN